MPVYSDTVIAYNRSDKEWTVFLKDGQVFATTEKMVIGDTLPFKPIFDQFDMMFIRGKICAIAVDSGFLVGLDKGEWGGTLYWFSRDGSSKYRVAYGNIVQFIQRGNEFYAIEGLAHLGSYFGQVLAIEKAAGVWKTALYSKLPTAPTGISIDYYGSFVISTHQRILVLTPDRKVHIAMPRAFWSGYLTPTSIVVKDTIAYIGMRKGVFKYNLKTLKQEWLMEE